MLYQTGPKYFSISKRLQVHFRLIAKKKKNVFYILCQVVFYFRTSLLMLLLLKQSSIFFIFYFSKEQLSIHHNSRMMHFLIIFFGEFCLFWYMKVPFCKKGYHVQKLISFTVIIKNQLNSMLDANLEKRKKKKRKRKRGGLY